jgi:tRNA U55 pseudouridine synthase TruB
MATLRRTETGGFNLEEAVPLDSVGPDDLRPLAEAVRVLPRVDLSPAHVIDVSHGRKLPADIAPDVAEGGLVAVYAQGTLVAVYLRGGDMLAADRVVPS